MNTKQVLMMVIALNSLWLSTPGLMAQGDERLAEIQRLSTEEKTKEVLVAARKYLQELRGTLPESDHPAIGYAAMIAGAAASSEGEHEQAVRLLKEGLPIVARMRAEQLWTDELQFSGSLVTSLKALERPEEALVLLDELVGRTRKELARLERDPKLKVNNPGGPAVDLDAMKVDEDWLVTLLEQMGSLQLEQKNWAEAEEVLKEAEEILKRVHPDEQQARLAELREGWEQAARAQGKPIRPQLVGRFGNPRMIRIEGAEQVSSDDIRSALTRSSTYVLASHPSAEFESYLNKLKRCLELGYRTTGFPEPAVEVDWDAEKNAVVARIVEGSRFKAGEIRISGAKTLKMEDLLERLIHEEDAEGKTINREERTYQSISEAKQMPGTQVQEAVRKVFPGSFPEENQKKAEMKAAPSPLWTTSDTSAEGVWTKNKWVDYKPSFLMAAEAVLRAAYAEEGHFFAKFELERVPGAAPDVVDLAVKVVEEGPPARLKKLHVAGNRINSEKELLDYLDLEEGMELRGDFMGRAKRALYESGRFLGWEVIGRRSQPQSSEMDLLILVAEQWEAPPLSQALTGEQEATLRFAKWLNAEAGEKSDLVFALSGQTEHGPLGLQVAVNNEAVALSADGFEHNIRAVGEWDGRAEVVVRTDQGPSFRAAFPVKGSPLLAYAKVIHSVPATPLAKTGNISFGLGFKSSSAGVLAPSIDPASALSMCGSQSGLVHRFEKGEMVLEGEDFTLRIDARSGRLISLLADGRTISLSGEWNGFALTGKPEVGAVERIRKEMKEMSQGVANWGTGKRPSALFFLALGYAAELVQDEDLGKADAFSKISLRVAKRAKRWEPLAVLLGDITATISEAFGSIGKKTESSTEAKFFIPLDTRELSARLQAGNIMSLLMGFGVFETLAEYIEPGTWPDLVAREVLFYLDGKPFYLNQSVETLLEDDSMGPLGCVLCARLLQQAGHPAAARFAAKARAELNDKGFAKDWTLALRGTARDDGLGWKILKALRNLREEQIDDFLPADPPEVRTTVKDLVAETRKIEPQTNADAFRPLMDTLWETVLDTVVEEVIDDTEERLTPKVDARIVAATVNEFPVLRSSVRLMDKLEGSMMVNNQLSASSAAWKLDKVKGNGPDGSSFENCVTTLLFAQQMWNKGQSALPEFVDQWTELLAKELGPDGWDQIAKMGMTKEPYKWWVGALIAAEAYAQQLGAQSKITEKEIRDFYERRKDLFTTGETETNVYTIRMKLVGKGSEQRKLAGEIRQRVAQAGPMKEMVDVFKEEAKEHSDDYEKDKGGHHGWVSLSYEFPATLAEAISKVPEQSLSEVIELTLKEQGYLYLVLIPDKRRPGQAAPFERVETEARTLAILDQERARLKKSAEIQVIDEPAGQDLAKDAPKEDAKRGFAALANKFLSEAVPDGGKVDEKESGDEVREAWSLDLVIRKAGEGSALHSYFLGSYAERGVARENGIEIAVKHYERAAEGGEHRAMMRLSELYRIGRRVDRDERKAQAWKEKAVAALEDPAGPERK